MAIDYEKSIKSAEDQIDKIKFNQYRLNSMFLNELIKYKEYIC